MMYTIIILENEFASSKIGIHGKVYWILYMTSMNRYIFAN